MNRGIIARPCEAEESYWEQDSSGHHGYQALLRDGNVVIFFELLVIAGLEEDHDSTADENTQDKSDVRQYYDWISVEEQIQDAVDECRVIVTGKIIGSRKRSLRGNSKCFLTKPSK